MSAHLTFVDYLKRVQEGIDAWKQKPHNAKWWKRIDGTPIPNDLAICIAEVLAKAAPAEPAPRGMGIPGIADRFLLRIAERYKNCSVNIYPEFPELTPVEAVLRCAQEEGFVLTQADALITRPAGASLEELDAVVKEIIADVLVETHGIRPRALEHTREIVKERIEKWAKLAGAAPVAGQPLPSSFSRPAAKDDEKEK